METMPRLPRILVLFGNVPLLGQERANIEALDALHRSGIAVRFLIRGEYTKDSIQAELDRRGMPFVTVPFYDTLRHGVPLRVWLRNLGGILGGSLRLLQEIRRFEATHIHVGSTANLLNFLPALLLTRLPVVFRAGDVPPQHHALWRWTWRFARRRAACFVCDSEFIKRRLTELGADPARLRVLYAPAPRRRRDPDAILNPLVDPSLFTVLYVGQLTEAKGLYLLVEAALELCRAHREVRFLIAGDFSWNNPFAEGLRRTVAAQGLQDRIRFLGFVEDIDALHEAAQVHVCPSLLEEAYGLTVLEAKVHQRPSVVFPSGGLQELVTDGVDGFVLQRRTAAELQRAIERYLDLPDLADRQGLEALKSLERLGVDRFEANWRAIYGVAEAG